VPASVQVLPEQHGLSFLPQGWQVEPVVLLVVDAQARSKLEQPLLVGKVLVGQQGSPALPQVQRPVLQVP
jgi:hypothetical protein